VTALEPSTLPRVYLASVVLFPLLFLSIAASKLGTYILPLLAPVVVLFLDRMQQEGQRWWRGILLATAAGFVVILVAALFAVPEFRMAGQEHRLVRFALFGFTWTLKDIEVMDLAAIDWSYLPLMYGLVVLTGAGALAAAFAAWRHLLGWSMALLGTSFALVAAAVLPRIDDIIRDLNGSRLIEVIRDKGGDNPALPVAERDPVIIHQEIVHKYELVYALRRRTGICEFSRELGMGHFIESTGPEVPLPMKSKRMILEGRVIDDPYHVDGNNLPQNPWLWSTDRLRSEWAKPRRLWLICEDEYLETLKNSGLTGLTIIDRARFILLVSNQP
jgi:hypothetical protein